MVIGTVIGSALLLGLGDAPTTQLAGFVSLLEQQGGAAPGAGPDLSGLTPAQLQPLVDSLLEFASRQTQDLVSGAVG